MEHFLGPKNLLKTQIFEKKAIFPLKKRFWPIFSRNIQHDKCRGTFYKGPQGALTIIVQTIRTFVWHLRGRQSQTFQKIAVFTMKAVLGPFFPALSGVTNPSEHLIRVHKVLKIIVQTIRTFVWHLRGRQKQTFQK